MPQSSPDLIALWQAGVAAVRGERAVETALAAANMQRPERILAVGKAACSMARAAMAAFPDSPCLIVTKYDHAADAPPGAEVLESAHPVPDQASLVAGGRCLDWVSNAPEDAHLLVLVSGGASSLVEALPEDMTLDDLKRDTQARLAAGDDIHALNTWRKRISRIKGGKLLETFPGTRVTTLAISDVEGDSLDVIGSGIGAAPAQPQFTFESHIIASNAHARAAVLAQFDGMPVVNAESLYADVTDLAPRLGQTLRDGPPGLYLWGGEPTVILPENPGLGGRNMALGLALAREIKGLPIEILVAGTDGTDGPTDAAGAHVTGATWQDSAAEALARADAYSWLKANDALFTSGPTGTNVMDLVLAWKRA